jgi:hypothetical protein
VCVHRDCIGGDGSQNNNNKQQQIAGSKKHTEAILRVKINEFLIAIEYH